VLVLAAFAFGMSALIHFTVFEGLPHLEDELAYLYQARIFGGGHATIETPRPATAYWQPFVVDYGATGRRFGKYTPGWPAMLALGVLVGQLWLVNATLSALTVALVSLLGSGIYGAQVGALAALLVAFSPAALLLNATLMSETASLFWATALLYSYWRMERDQSGLLGPVGVGVSLGALASTRPLSAVAIGLPLFVHSGARLLAGLCRALRRDDGPSLTDFQRTLRPLLIVSTLTLLLASSIPWFNYLATGNPWQNLYRLVWSWDRVGFGEGYGPHAHSLRQGFAQARFDLSLAAADLFGWQLESIDGRMIRHFQIESGYYPGHGMSFVLLPFGLLLGTVGFVDGRRKLLAALIASWSLGALGWALLPAHLATPVLGRTVAQWLGMASDASVHPGFSWFWIVAALLWLLVPLPLLERWQSPRASYTWVFAAIALATVIVQMTYWIGAQRYGPRYYFGALSSAALLSALALAGLARVLGRRGWVVLGALLLLSVLGLVRYSLPRIATLYRFNQISPALIEGAEARRDGERPVVVIVNGPNSGPERVRWRSYGSLMAVTSPYLDGEIVAARDPGTLREQILARFAGRQVIDLDAAADDAAFQLSSARRP
jgi:hypothetical protein